MADMDSWPPKDPLEVLEYAFDWRLELDPGESLLTAAWSASPAGLVLGPDAIAGGHTSVWVEAGVRLTPYVLSCLVTITGGRTMKRSGRLDVTNR